MTVPTDAAAALETARTMLGLSHLELWYDYVALGGNHAPDTILAFLDQNTQIAEPEYDRLVQALNEHFIDSGDNHPLPYADELPPQT